MAIIGVIMLVGIAVNDAIILVDRINQLKREGMSSRRCYRTSRSTTYSANSYDEY